MFDLHKEAKLSVGNNMKLLSAYDIKRYTASKDKNLFGPIRRLPMNILESIGLSNLEVVEPIVATCVIDLYLSSSPRPSQPTTDPTTSQNKQHKPKRIKSLSISKKAPINIVTKGVGTPKKRKSKTAKFSSVALHSCSKTLDPHVNVFDETHQESSVSGDDFRRKKLKLNPSQIHMRTMTHTPDSQKSPIVIGVTADSPSHTPTHHSNA